MVGGAHTYSLDDGGRETKKGGDGKMEIALCLTFQWVFHFRVISVTMETFLFFFLLAALCLGCCTRAFSSCGEQGLLFFAVRGLLIAVASLVVEHGLSVHGLQ